MSHCSWKDTHLILWEIVVKADFLLRAVFTVLWALVFSFPFDSNAADQDGCEKDGFGRIFCAPAGGAAVMKESTHQVLCAPGKCVVDAFGRWHCSNEVGGDAILDDQKRPVCVGECIPPTKEYCTRKQTK